MSEKIRRLVVAGMITAIILLLGMTGLGYPMIPPLRVTIVHVPVAIGAMLLGPWYGLLFGAMFGMTSMYQAAIGGLPTAPLFLDVRVALIPRLCVPVMAYLAYKLFDKIFKGKKRLLSGTIGGLAAGATNTILVLGSIYLFYGVSAASMFSVAPETFLMFLIGIGGSSGIPEAIACGILSGSIMGALSRQRRDW